ncbi:hypothetical protein HYFRA_00009451 [Hymenoscyphus fraxineus]|uniref:Uncharacterized protein n=1 Tax=Hymenoscyphus fraxineus TaxID=746836 RepID=A0A9N9L183_9HELO|nr:hypothetical protein HYFRA_00009451 [Hymenoscyphus fraxineus]
MAQSLHKTVTEPLLGNQIPKIWELQEELGLRDASRGLKESLKNGLVRLRETYRTQEGGTGESLVHWSVQAVQMDLGTMAELFLVDGAGERFWCAERSWIRKGDLVYPKDKAKQNTNSQRNATRIFRADKTDTGDEEMDNTRQGLIIPRASPLATFTSTEDPPRCILIVPLSKELQEPLTGSDRLKAIRPRPTKRSYGACYEPEGSKLSSTSYEGFVGPDDRAHKRRKESLFHPEMYSPRRTNRSSENLEIIPEENLQLLGEPWTKKRSRKCAQEDGIISFTEVAACSIENKEIISPDPLRRPFPEPHLQAETSQFYVTSGFPQSSSLSALGTNEGQVPYEWGSLQAFEPRQDFQIPKNILLSNTTGSGIQTQLSTPSMSYEDDVLNHGIQTTFAISPSTNSLHTPSLPSCSPCSLPETEEAAATSAEPKIQERSTVSDQVLHDSDSITLAVQIQEPKGHSLADRSFSQLQFPSMHNLSSTTYTSLPRISQNTEDQTHVPSPSFPKLPEVQKPKPITMSIPLWIMTQDSEKLWTGPKLVDLSLSAFRLRIASLTTSDPQNIVELEVILLGPKKIIMRIPCEGADEMWDFVKSGLTQNIKRFRRANRAVDLKIHVEPIWKEGTFTARVQRDEIEDDEDIEVDF